ncbi:cytochrome P450 [Streptomyces varsoviensis]|nr:cytochrome P450 [Streptomyces varsoviensis]
MPQEIQHEFDHARRTGFGPGAPVRRLHARAPVNRVAVAPGPNVSADGPPVWLVTGYEEVRRVLADHARFSTRLQFGVGPSDEKSDLARPRETVGHLTGYDPPEHTRLRKMLTPEFTARRIQRLAPPVEEVVRELLDDMEDVGQPADLVEMYARPIAGAALCELIGVPLDDRPDFVRRVQRQMEPGLTPRQRADARDSYTGYLGALVRRRRKDPDEGFIGTLVREHGDEFTDEELRGACTLMFAAGLDNVSGMISLGVLVLLRHPDQLAGLLENPSSADRVIDELLRYLSVVHAPTPRVALEDVTVGGQLVKAGEQVVCSIPMANRDPALAPDADRFDSTRAPVPHLAFGHGIHYCIGAAMARLELRIAYLALWHRFPGLRLAVPPDEVAFRHNAVAHGLEALPVAW